MTGMADYIKAVIVMGTVSSLVVMALPSESERTGKYVKYLSVLMLLTVMFSPLAGISTLAERVADFFGRESMEDVQTDYNGSVNAVVAQTAENLSEYIKNICNDRFGQRRDTLKVKLILDESDTENIVINEIQIFTGELDGTVREKMSDYFTELFQTEVFVFGT